MVQGLGKAPGSGKALTLVKAIAAGGYRQSSIIFLLNGVCMLFGSVAPCTMNALICVHKPLHANSMPACEFDSSLL